MTNHFYARNCMGCFKQKSWIYVQTISSSRVSVLFWKLFGKKILYYFFSINFYHICSNYTCMETHFFADTFTFLWVFPFHYVESEKVLLIFFTNWIWLSISSIWLTWRNCLFKFGKHPDKRWYLRVIPLLSKEIFGVDTSKGKKNTTRKIIAKLPSLKTTWSEVILCAELCSYNWYPLFTEKWLVCNVWHALLLHKSETELFLVLKWWYMLSERAYSAATTC